MKFRKLLPFVVALAAACAAHAQGIKCATVDANKLITEYHVAKKEIAELRKTRDQYTLESKERHKKLDDVEGKIKDLITKLRDKAMPKSERDTLMEEYEELASQHNALSKDLQEADRDQAREIKSAMAAATRRLLDEIHVVIHQYAKDHQYNWIIDTSGLSNSQISPLIYARKAPDVTGEILAILNKDAPKTQDGPEKPADGE